MSMYDVCLKSKLSNNVDPYLTIFKSIWRYVSVALHSLPASKASLGKIPQQWMFSIEQKS